VKLVDFLDADDGVCRDDFIAGIHHRVRDEDVANRRVFEIWQSLGFAREVLQLQDGNSVPGTQFTMDSGWVKCNELKWTYVEDLEKNPRQIHYQCGRESLVRRVPA
jgi:hypothetical protein